MSLTLGSGGFIEFNGAKFPVENIEISHKSSTKTTVPISMIAAQPIEITMELPADAFAKVWAEIERDLIRSMGVPVTILNPLPEWVSRVIRIPESRIRQILGK